MKINIHILNKLNEQYLTCKSRYYKHIKTAEYYKNLYIRTTIPIILLSSITTILASFNGNFMNADFAIVVAVFSGLTTICQALASFLEYNAKYDLHLNIANKFITLARFIETEVYVNYYTIKETTDDANFTFIKNLLERIQKDFGSIQDVEPYIPSFINEHKYTDVKCGTSNIQDLLFVPKSINSSSLNENEAKYEVNINIPPPIDIPSNTIPPNNIPANNIHPNNIHTGENDIENSVKRMLIDNPRNFDSYPSEDMLMAGLST